MTIVLGGRRFTGWGEIPRPAFLVPNMIRQLAARSAQAVAQAREASGGRARRAEVAWILGPELQEQDPFIGVWTVPCFWIDGSK